MDQSRKTSLLLFFLITSSLFVPAQTYVNNSLANAIIRSDSNCRSALISNQFDQRGDRSQLMGIGSVHTNGNVWECRSLLAFDYSKLPAYFKASNLSKAQLVLYPLQPAEEGLQGNDGAKRIGVVVKRITGFWDDSLITWKNQPPSDEINSVIKMIPLRKKNEVTWIDVTKQVKKMLVEGNQGFMISSILSRQDVNTSMQWFGSARHEEKSIRPVLVLEFLLPKDSKNFETLSALSESKMKQGDEEYEKFMRELKYSPVVFVPIQTTPQPKTDSPVTPVKQKD